MAAKKRAGPKKRRWGWKIALALLLLEFAVLDRRNPLLAHLNIFREK